MVLHVVQLNPPCLAGSTLLPLTTSGGLSGAVSLTGGRYGSVTIGASICVSRPCADARLVDLLPLAFLRSSEHYSFLCHFGRYNPNKLSSGYFDLCLPLPRALTSHNFEALDAFFNRGLLLYSFPSQRRECSSPVVIFLVVLMLVFDYRISIDRHSHVRPSLHCSLR
jgi:hypothetical protein